MPTKTSELLRSASAAAVPVVQGVDESLFGNETPCAEYRVEELLNHLFQVVVNFQALAAKQPADFSSTPGYLTGPWRERFAQETERLVEAWADPAALDGISPGMGLPQEVVGDMALLDLTVHAWDLAHATGQDFQPDPDAVRQLDALIAAMGEQARQMNVFGQPVVVPDDAPLFDKLLAATGRDPAWRA